MIMFAYESTMLILPNPQFGEALTSNVKTQFEHSMTGAVYSFKYTEASKSFSLPFRMVSRGKVMEIKVFLKLIDGKVVDYVDYDGVTHKVVIVDDFEVTPNGKGNNGIPMYDFNLTLERTQ